MASTSPFIHPDDLSDVFPPQILERGRRYFLQRRVLTADFHAAKAMAVGRVKGSGGRIYQCVVHLGQQTDGTPMVVGQCSCPVGYNCKHVVAVLIHLIEDADSDPHAPVPVALPLEVRNWLSAAQQLAERVSDEDPYRLVYLVRCDTRFGLRHGLVRAVKARRLASGDYGKTQDFNILGHSQARVLRHEDERILALARANKGTVGTDTEAVLGHAAGLQLLQAIATTGRGHWLDTGGPVLKWAGPLDGRLTWRLGEDARLRVVLEAERAGLELIPVAPPCWLDPESGDCGPLQSGLGDRQAALLAAAPPFTPEAAAALEEAATQRLQGLELPLPHPPKRRRAESARPIPCLRLYSEDLAAAFHHQHWRVDPGPDWSETAALHFDYGGVAVDPRDRSPLLYGAEDGVLVERERDLDAETAAIGVLEELGFERVEGEAGDTELSFELPEEDPAWLWFMDAAVPRLKADGWRIEIEEGFRFQVARLGEWQMEVAEREGGRWLDMALGVEVDGERLDLLPLLVDLLQRYDVDLSSRTSAQLDDEATLPVRLQDGRLLMVPAMRLRPILSTLVELYDPQALDGNGRLPVPRTQAAQLAQLEQEDPQLAWNGGEAAREWGRRLKDFEGIRECTPPTGLGTELRSYQRQGLDWLQFLRELELGGVLADDMGLGKTVQALAHLLLEKDSGRADRPSLVVAPTSLMFNWRREAKRFAPALRVLVLHGPGRRKHFDAIADHDLVLTTYPLLPRDLGALSEAPYHLLILDEAQAIKNPHSKAAQAAHALDARHRLCLTGTPLENHLGELWSLLDFLMPGMLGDERRFKRLFRTPIERFGDDARQDQLRRRVAPFLLRRTKEAVATELPPKTEILREVPLVGDQRDLYETLRLALHEKVRKEVESKGMARSGIIILDALLKLRQACCDPRLVALEAARKVKRSAKLDLLMTLLPELLEEGRSILLFSQFTSMLELIEAELMRLQMRQNEDFVKLTGRTRNRALPVDRFQAGEVRLFLISLKAGGSGLNLTAADTVIHYDPWWNPAAERQATDRAHRIGQDKPVFVYKLLTEGTVEQKVAELQARKQALADAMLAGGGAAAGSLSAEDLELLFAPVQEQ